MAQHSGHGTFCFKETRTEEEDGRDGRNSEVNFLTVDFKLDFLKDDFHIFGSLLETTNCFNFQIGNISVKNPFKPYRVNVKVLSYKETFVNFKKNSCTLQ